MKEKEKVHLYSKMPTNKYTKNERLKKNHQRKLKLVAESLIVSKSRKTKEAEQLSQTKGVKNDMITKSSAHRLDPEVSA